MSFHERQNIWRSAPVRYVAAVVFTLLAFLARMVLDPYVYDRRPDVTFFVAVIVVAWLYGSGPAVLSMILGFLAADWFFILPRHSFMVGTLVGWVTIVSYFVVASAVIVSTHEMRKAREQAFARKEDLEREIEERRQAEEELLRQAALLSEQSQLLDLAHVLIRDSNDRIVTWNTGAELLYGFSKEEAIGRVSHELLKTVFPVSKEAVGEALASTDHWQGVLVHTAKDGSRVVVASHQVQHRDENGKPSAVIEINNDITEQKRTEEALRESRAKLEAALESMTDAVFISDTEGRFIDFNEAFATFHRFNDKEECMKTLAEYPDILEVYTPDGELAPLEKWAVPRALRGETATNAEYTLRRKDTGEKWVGSYSFAPIRDSEGKIVGSVVTGRDITELKQAEQALRELEEHKREFYRRTILAATEGKLLMSERQEIEKVAGPALATWEIDPKVPMVEGMKEAMQLVSDAGMEEARLLEFRGCITEAVANAVKHANGGVMSLQRVGDRLICVISDSGPGIGTMALPDVALTKNYSTAGTLGMGYKLMIRFADKVYLATGTDGTTVALEMKVNGES